MAELIQLRWFDLYYLRYRRRETTRPVEYFHAHDGIEFLYIHEGTGQLILNNRFYRIEPLTLIFFQPFQPHLLYTSFPYTRSILKIKLPLDERFAQLFPTLQQFLLTLTNQSVNQVYRLSKEQDAEFDNQFRMFKEMLPLTSTQERKEHFLSFWSQFLSYFKTRLFTIQQNPESIQHPREAQHVEKTVQWIEDHYKQPIDLDTLAAEIHLNPSYLSRLFRKCTGSTIMEYIGKRRMEEANLLLRTSSLSISQVAQLSGYTDVAYFCRCFKKRYGATPLQYRTSNS